MDLSGQYSAPLRGGISGLIFFLSNAYGLNARHKRRLLKLP